MTKKEKQKQINKRFYAFIENNFPEYNIDSGEGGGRIYLIPKETNRVLDSIEYHQSLHTLLCFNSASEKTHSDMKIMEKYINENIIPYVEYLLNETQK